MNTTTYLKNPSRPIAVVSKQRHFNELLVKQMALKRKSLVHTVCLIHQEIIKMGKQSCQHFCVCVYMTCQQWTCAQQEKQIFVNIGLLLWRLQRFPLLAASRNRDDVTGEQFRSKEYYISYITVCVSNQSEYYVSNIIVCMSEQGEYQSICICN